MSEALPFGITVCGIDELEGHCETRATHVLSILDPDHPVPEAFGRFGEHEKLELRFHDVIEAAAGAGADTGVIPPGEADVARILAFGRALAEEPGARLLVHCHAGISRSTASMILILAQALPHRPARAIVAMVHGIREKAWPNLRILEIGDRMLGRGGSLVEAAASLYRLQIDKRPGIGKLMAGDGRGREVDLAAKAA